MVALSDKRQLCWLIDQYLFGKINGSDFSNELYKCFDLEINFEMLTQAEYEAFSSLARVASRFTSLEDDLVRYPGVYFTPEQLHQKIIETKRALQNCWPNLETQDSDAA
jgi:hypothetical protein